MQAVLSVAVIKIYKYCFITFSFVLFFGTYSSLCMFILAKCYKCLSQRLRGDMIAFLRCQNIFLSDKNMFCFTIVHNNLEKFKED